MSVLDGKPLDYRIGTSAGEGRANRVTMAPWMSETKPSIGIAVLYVNLFDEHESYNKETNTGDYDPYLTRGDVADRYDEGQCDPDGEGFWRNLDEQLIHANALGFEYVELDNRDAYRNSVILKCFSRCAAKGLGVFCKNPGMSNFDESSVELLKHSAVHGMILEKGDVSADDVQTMRVEAGVPFLALWIVAFTDGRGWAVRQAGQIKSRGYKNMGVTNSRGGEYIEVEDILLPEAPYFPHPTDEDQQQPSEPAMAWRLAKSLETLRAQVNAHAPKRDKNYDGTIGDEAHASRSSDHNPNSSNVVTAMDITHDPGDGVDAGAIAEALRLSRDPRIKYVISNARIFSSLVSPWEWRRYTGSNAHRAHVHVSVMGTSKLWDDTKPWSLPWGAVEEMESEANGRQRRITATVWTDAMGAYGPLDHSQPLVSLPAVFPRNALPFVRVYGPEGTAIGQVADKGPWYDGTASRPADAYWKSGKRPRAENDSNTNGAAIDVNEVLARRIGLPGTGVMRKGTVDWEFVDATPQPVPVPTPEPVPAPVPGPIPQPVPLPFFNWQPLLVDLWPIIRANLPALIPIMIKHLPSIIPILVPYLAGTQPMEKEAMTYESRNYSTTSPPRDPDLTPKALVNVQPAVQSKINWVQIIGIGASILAVLTGGQINLTPEQIAGTVVAIQTVQGFVTFVMRTWFTTTVTPASMQK